MDEVSEIFKLYRFTHAVLSTYSYELAAAHKKFDEINDVVLGIDFLQKNPERRGPIEHSLGFTLTPQDYNISFEHAVERENMMNIPALATKIRVDALYARDVFKLYWEIACRPEDEQLSCSRHRILHNIDQVNMVIFELRRRNLMAASTPFFIRGTEYIAEYNKVWLNQYLLRSAARYDKKRAKMVFADADILKQKHDEFIKLVDQVRANMAEFMSQTGPRK